MRTIGAIAAISLLALAGCEKDSGLPSKTSGSLRAHESSLLEGLPGGNIALFGGNYMRLQDFFQKGPMAKVMGQMEALMPGMRAWTDCLLNVQADPSQLQMVGGVTYADGKANMALVMRGWTLHDLDTCAKKAEFPSTLDPDGKYISIELPNPMGKQTTGYLSLPDGSLFYRQEMPFPPSLAAPTSTTRADLEAAAAAARRNSAAGDDVLLAEASRIDRDRDMWLVANLNSTPAGDKVGLVRGWVDLEGGIDVDLNLEINDGQLADQLASELPRVKREAHRLGREIGDVIKGLRYERKGNRFRFGLKVTNAQMEAIMSSMGGMLGGGGF